MSSEKWRPFCLGLNVLRQVSCEEFFIINDIENIFADQTTLLFITAKKIYHVIWEHFKNWG